MIVVPNDVLWGIRPIVLPLRREREREREREWQTDYD